MRSSSHPTSAASATQPGVPGSRLEKRGSGRIPAHCAVLLRYGLKLGARRRAELLNVGREGFRARHGDRRIAAGKLVSFQHRFAHGMARVMWTRPNGGLFESGFEIVDRGG